MIELIDGYCTAIQPGLGQRCRASAPGLVTG